MESPLRQICPAKETAYQTDKMMVDLAAEESEIQSFGK